MFTEYIETNYFLPYFLSLIIVFGVGYILDKSRLPFWINIVGMCLMLGAGLLIIDMLFFLFSSSVIKDNSGEIVAFYVNGTAKLENGTFVNISSIPGFG